VVVLLAKGIGVDHVKHAAFTAGRHEIVIAGCEPDGGGRADIEIVAREVRVVLGRVIVEHLQVAQRDGDEAAAVIARRRIMRTIAGGNVEAIVQPDRGSAVAPDAGALIGENQVAHHGPPWIAISMAYTPDCAPPQP